jgi:hypothetical protein
VFSLAGDLVPARSIAMHKPPPALVHKEPVRLAFDQPKTMAKIPLDAPDDEDEWAEF